MAKFLLQSYNPKKWLIYSSEENEIIAYPPNSVAIYSNVGKIYDNKATGNKWSYPPSPIKEGEVILKGAGNLIENLNSYPNGLKELKEAGWGNFNPPKNITIGSIVYPLLQPFTSRKCGHIEGGGTISGGMYKFYIDAFEPGVNTNTTMRLFFNAYEKDNNIIVDCKELEEGH